VTTETSVLTLNVEQQSGVYLVAMPKRVALLPAVQLSCTPVSRSLFTFWKTEPKNSVPSFLQPCTVHRRDKCRLQVTYNGHHMHKD